ncbi:hypothetical protein PGTUg99_032067 [Puccinia graminis f. sp. tritici]|uniref:Uncharacterized protein n=1 Tax=Puccinia graminis f. sp. tritici TaxID=56615 RepID=A0A5B0LWV2_PUCGR|nr:hypothetical protein PGTUg99_032067 [Puccinia graminis f. sp. tritici]
MDCMELARENTFKSHVAGLYRLVASDVEPASTKPSGTQEEQSGGPSTLLGPPLLSALGEREGGRKILVAP